MLELLNFCKNSKRQKIEYAIFLNMKPTELRNFCNVYNSPSGSSAIKIINKICSNLFKCKAIINYVDIVLCFDPKLTLDTCLYTKFGDSCF